MIAGEGLWNEVVSGKCFGQKWGERREWEAAAWEWWRPERVSHFLEFYVRLLLHQIHVHCIGCTLKNTYVHLHWLYIKNHMS